MHKTKKTGSTLGLALVIGIGFLFYFVLGLIGGNVQNPMCETITNEITRTIWKQCLWFLMNFAEPQTCAGIFSGLGVILGSVTAWIFAMRNSKLAGFDICYGNSNIFPWLFASQLLSLSLTIFVFKYINIFDTTGVSWVPTFITLVGAPPSIMMLYGPSMSALLVSSVLASLLSVPMATWITEKIVTPLGLPGVVAVVTTLAVTGIIICQICKVLPWVKKKPVVSHRTIPAPIADVHSASWMVRRAFADFTEAQFYGNEVVTIFLLIGCVLDWCIGTRLPNSSLPAIILSQFIGSGVGIFLYANKFDNGGWYGTCVPVLSVGPACVLTFGATIPVSVFAGVLGGVIGAPIASFLAEKLPEDIHITNGTVTSMAVSTIVVIMVMKYSGIF